MITMLVLAIVCSAWCIVPILAGAPWWVSVGVGLFCAAMGAWLAGMCHAASWGDRGRE
jgi:hypothetical protein